ncbi:MAG: sugar phosphate isomerase/epimerase [Clostridia bacterium]|nr:sugar phosphate isomerase/epimerase [Clostridia bacterium]
MIIGAQLFSLRNFAKTLDDFSETLKKVADIGYTTVQVSGTCEYEAEWLRAELEKNGLRCDLTHYSFDKMVADPQKVSDFHRVFDCKYIGVGSMPGMWGDADKIDFPAITRDFAQKANVVGDAFAQNGQLLMYHNHAREYFCNIDGLNAMEYLAQNVPAEKMGFTLDTHWILAGNREPVSEIRNFAGRIPTVHLKDMCFAVDGARRFAPVGSGIMSFEPILAAFEDAGSRIAFVEQDDCYGEDPFLCLKKSYDYLKSLGLN